MARQVLLATVIASALCAAAHAQTSVSSLVEPGAPTDGGAPVSAAQAQVISQGSIASQLSTPFDMPAGSTIGGKSLADATMIPTPFTNVPPSPTPAGIAGSASNKTYVPGNAAVMSLCRRTSVTTASDGSFTASWTTPLASSAPWAGIDPLWVSGAQPPTCSIKTATANGVTGQCLPFQTMTLSLAIVTAGTTVSPLGAGTGAAGITVKVHACEPTQ